ncbi:MAG: hypothetical protein PHW93_06755 [Candidatus Methanomethylophilaceae archaeon]|nr:hypothetical protein [Candidatus Methanomethylophilaceae archaeon]
MRYIGTRAMEVIINIEASSVAKENEELVNSGILNILETKGNTFKVMVPENVKSLEDAKYIAFECVTGYPFAKEFNTLLKVSIDTIKYMNDDFIYCLTIAEFRDFDVAKMEEYIAQVEASQEVPVGEVKETEVVE